MNQENNKNQENNENKSVSLENVSKTFNAGKPNQVEALAGVSLSVDRGDFITLIGPSGCGKSTLLRLIGGLIAQTGGNLSVNGKTPIQARQDKDYGMAFQTAGLLEWRTALRNVELPLELMGWSRKARQKRALEMLDLVQLKGFQDSRPSELSGGMQQRVAIGRALSFEPSLLLMDEPFGALDEMTREHMQNELMSIYNKTNTTVIFVTHSIPEAVFLSTRVVVMSPRPGKITQIVDVDLGERNLAIRENDDFFHKVTEVREALRSQGSI